jgi:hypothetical protein
MLIIEVKEIYTKMLYAYLDLILVPDSRKQKSTLLYEISKRQDPRNESSKTIICNAYS